MARYIDLMEFEKRIKENVPTSDDGNTPREADLLEWCKDECIRQAYAMPIVHVEEAKRGEWISVDERLPELNTDVLVYTKWGKRSTVEVCILDEEGDWMGVGQHFTHDSVTHWMPLPEAPKVR